MAVVPKSIPATLVDVSVMSIWKKPCFEFLFPELQTGFPRTYAGSKPYITEADEPGCRDEYRRIFKDALRIQVPRVSSTAVLDVAEI